MKEVPTEPPMLAPTSFRAETCSAPGIKPPDTSRLKKVQAYIVSLALVLRARRALRQINPRVGQSQLASRFLKPTCHPAHSS